MTVQNADTTAPTVSVTAPGGRRDGQRAPSTVTATAADNVGVAGVQFQVDGATSARKTRRRRTRSAGTRRRATNGTHALRAIARDAAGNQTTSAAVSVTVANVVASGLVAAYGFEEGAGSTVGDASGSGEHGGDLGGDVGHGREVRKGALVQRDEQPRDRERSAALHLTTAMTLEAWVRPRVGRVAHGAV